MVLIVLNAQNRIIYVDQSFNKLHGNYFIFSFLICLLLIISLYLSWLYLTTKIRLKESEKRLKNEFFTRQKQQNQISITQIMFNSQEQERNRIARELHDGIGAKLSTLKMKLSTINQNIKNKDIKNSIDLLDQTIKEIRHISHNIMPEIIYKYGLKQSLRDYFLEVESAYNNKIIYFNSYGNWQNISKQSELYIYRIINELVHNSLKYSESDKIIVDFIFSTEIISITIEDNGKGFDLEKIKKSFGLNNVKSRVLYLNGSIDIKSEKNIGTSIYIEIPITKNI